ncbi:hypothetical protein CH333_09635 [candidate division WOR-3 bacterium JGI_Cruoil_03_44_89]|uniref:Polyhydroxyalkanoate synthesis regulator n=1 Tax=candidate division WOR-3 bacterium JGI_Cruoil_03_44_89 TaxID=1973748 RepID=A0A235BNS7_UNCW3|nr:MAG: hypothetical protein CH333_09635 [candidate division WOR-3 bacterium JGI_Cruoil_03_44_89]
MRGPIEKAFLMGLGSLSLARERAEKTIEELVKKGESAKEKRPEFVKRLLDRGKASRAEIKEIAEKTVTKVMGKLNVPTKTDIDAFMKKIEKLTKK